jgi:hypothetical protein
MSGIEREKPAVKRPYFVYWNLHKDLYSLRYKTKVIEHPEGLYLTNCELRVQPGGRKRVLETRRKNVHAGIAANSFLAINDDHMFLGYRVITYDSYRRE